MLLERISIKALLSFGPGGIDLPMPPLNVLIGPNGSGKTNFIEALALLKAAPDDFSRPIRDAYGQSQEIAPQIFERVFPLPTNLVKPLPAFIRAATALSAD